MNRYGDNGWSALVSGFTQPAVGETTTIDIGPWNESTSAVVIQGAGLYAITSFLGNGQLVIRNMGFPGSLQPGLPVYSGTLVSAGTFASGVGGGGGGSARSLVALGTLSGLIQIEASTGAIFDVTLNGNATFSFISAPSLGTVVDFTLRIHQDTTGGWTATWPAQGEWPGKTPFTLTATAGAMDIVGVEIDGSGNWIGYPVSNVG